MIFLISGSAFGSTNGNTNNGRNTNEPKVEPTAESTSANTGSVSETAKTSEEAAAPNPHDPHAPDPALPETESEPKKSQQDSTSVNSLSKFNFVFYFIYKLKYNSESTGNEYLDFQF